MIQTDPLLMPRMPARLGKMASDQGVNVYKTASDRAMVALRIPAHVADQIKIPGGERAADLHCTLVYLGDVAEINPDNLRTLKDRLEAIGLTQPPVEGRIAGYGRFAPSEDEDVIWCGLDAPDLAELRHLVLQAVLDSGIIPIGDHGFTPHITLAYVEPGEGEDSMPPNADVDIRYLSLAVGDHEVMIPLKGPRAAVFAAPTLPTESFSDLQQPSVEFSKILDLERWAQNQGSLMVRSDTPGVGAVVVKKGTDIAIGIENWEGPAHLDDLIGALGAIKHDLIMVGRVAAWDPATESWVDGTDMTAVLLAERIAAPVFFAADILVLDGDISRQPARERFERLRVVVAPAGGAVAVPLQQECKADQELDACVDEVSQWQPNGREGGWYCPGVTVVGADSPYSHGVSENEVRLVLSTKPRSVPARKDEGLIGIGSGGGVTERPVEIIDDRIRKPHFPDIRPIAALKAHGSFGYVKNDRRDLEDIGRAEGAIRDRLAKFNPNHDPGGEGGGQFTSGDGSGEADTGPSARTAAIGPTAEAQAHLKKLDSDPKVQEARRVIKETPQTVDQYKADGEYTPERTMLHEKIVQESLNPSADVPKGGTPVATFVLGLPASGKSGALKPTIESLDKATVIDPDAVKAKLPEYDGKNAANVHVESGEIAEGPLLHAALKRNQNVVFDLVGKNQTKMLELAYLLKARGYAVDLRHVTIPPIEAAKRAMTRFDETGRFVDPAYIIETVGNRSDATYEALKNSGVLRNWESYDNSGPIGSKPKLRERGGEVRRGIDSGGDVEEAGSGGVWKDGFAGATTGNTPAGILAPQQGMFRKPKRSRYMNVGDIRTDLTLLKWQDGDSFAVGYGIVGGHTFRMGKLVDGQFVPDKDQPRVNPYEAIFQRKGVLLGLGTLTKSAIDQAQQDREQERDLREQQEHDQSAMVGALVAMSEAGISEGVAAAIVAKIQKIGWTDEARAKALETRRQNAAGKTPERLSPEASGVALQQGTKDQYKVKMRDANGETLIAPDGQVYSGQSHSRMAASVGHNTGSSIDAGYVRGRIEDGSLSAELDMKNEQARANAKALISAHGKDSNVYVDVMPPPSEPGKHFVTEPTAVFVNPGAVGKALRFIDSAGKDRSETKPGTGGFQRMSKGANDPGAMSVAEWEESKHPRAPDGKWTDGSQATKPPAEPAGLKQPSLPGLESQGSGWEPENEPDKIRQLYLEEESAKAVAVSQKEWDDLVGSDVTITGKGGWDSLSDDDKTEYQNTWENDNIGEYITQQTDEWQNSSEAQSKKGEAASEQFYDKVSDSDLDEAVRDALKSNATFASDAQRDYFHENMDVSRLYQMGEAEDDREVSKAFDAVMRGYDLPEGEELATIDASGFTSEIRSAHDSLLEKVAEDIEVEPDDSEQETIQQNAYEAASEAFMNLSQSDLDDLAGGGNSKETFTVEEPTKWLVEQPDSSIKFGKLGDEEQIRAYKKAEKAYEATRQAAQAMVQKRAEGLWAERFGDKRDAPDFHVVGDTFWNDWKHDSNAKGTHSMQNALISELGANSLGRQDTTPPSDEQAVYAKALWQTTQFVLHKSGTREVYAYRGIIMDGTKLEQEHVATQVTAAPGPLDDQDPDKGKPGYTPAAPKTYGKYEELNLKQGPAQSFTFDKSVANSWGGVGSSPKNNPHRVVLRVALPPEAVWSLPVYGKNLQNENEVVVLGTPWKTWEAWDQFAPDFKEVPINPVKVTETPTMGEPKKLAA